MTKPTVESFPGLLDVAFPRPLDAFASLAAHSRHVARDTYGTPVSGSVRQQGAPCSLSLPSTAHSRPRRPPPARRPPLTDPASACIAQFAFVTTAHAVCRAQLVAGCQLLPDSPAGYLLLTPRNTRSRFTPPATHARSRYPRPLLSTQAHARVEPPCVRIAPRPAHARHLPSVVRRPPALHLSHCPLHARTTPRIAHARHTRPQVFHKTRARLPPARFPLPAALALLIPALRCSAPTTSTTSGFRYSPMPATCSSPLAVSRWLATSRRMLATRCPALARFFCNALTAHAHDARRPLHARVAQGRVGTLDRLAVASAGRWRTTPPGAQSGPRRRRCHARRASAAVAHITAPAAGPHIVPRAVYARHLTARRPPPTHRSLLTGGRPSPSLPSARAWHRLPATHHPPPTARRPPLAPGGLSTVQFPLRADCPPLTADCPLPSARRSCAARRRCLLTTMFAARRHSLPAAIRSPCAVRRLMPTGRCTASAYRCPLPAMYFPRLSSHCPLPAAHFPLPAASCSLPTAACVAALLSPNTPPRRVRAIPDSSHTRLCESTRHPPPLPHAGPHGAHGVNAAPPRAGFVAHPRVPREHDFRRRPLSARLPAPASSITRGHG
ncbi:hypothetical protein GGX14DRAFT_581067 [Mycena pura]|uniref:Uncharacterized protein n=1 Tax=Mycena pura TaxID=153505 RepID=A0AAD6XVA9_9AGAR|nr:hypothetical protein GGX14DRAFT_581067 [Mycena pura]